MGNDIQSGIYVWKLDGVPKYVGQGANVRKRMMNKHTECKVLQAAIKKYGYDAFGKEILLFCGKTDLEKFEIEYIKKLKTHVSSEGYNVSWGGKAPMTGRNRSNKTRKIMSEQRRGNLYNLGRKPSSDTREKMRISHTGTNNAMYGKHRSAEVKEKLRIANFGKTLTLDTIRKIGDSHFGKKTGKSSKYFGVSIMLYQSSRTCWRSTVKIKGVHTYIGKFKTELLAAQAYDKYIIDNNLPNPLNFPNNYISKDKYQFLLLQNHIKVA